MSEYITATEIRVSQALKYKVSKEVLDEVLNIIKERNKEVQNLLSNLKNTKDTEMKEVETVKCRYFPTFSQGIYTNSGLKVGDIIKSVCHGCDKYGEKFLEVTVEREPIKIEYLVDRAVSNRLKEGYTPKVLVMSCDAFDLLEKWFHSEKRVDFLNFDRSYRYKGFYVCVDDRILGTRVFAI